MHIVLRVSKMYFLFFFGCYFTKKKKCSSNLKMIWGRYRQICHTVLISFIISYFEKLREKEWGDVGWKRGINQTAEWSLSVSHVKTRHVWPSLSLAVFATRWQHIISGAFVSWQSYEYIQCLIYTNSLNNVGTSSSYSLSFLSDCCFLMGSDSPYQVCLNLNSSRHQDKGVNSSPA